MPQNKGTVRELFALLPSGIGPDDDPFHYVQKLLDEGLLTWTDPDRTLNDYHKPELRDVCLPVRITPKADRQLAKPAS